MSRRSLAVTLLCLAGGMPWLSFVLGWGWYVDGPQLLPAVVAGYAAGAWLSARGAALGVVVAVIALVAGNQLHGVEYHWLDDLVFFLVLVGGPAAAGAAVKVRTRQVRQLEKISAEYDEQQRVEVAAARLEEQVRIQERVHARLAERIAAIAVRAEGAQVAGSGEALAAIEAEARGVLDHLREALGSFAETPGDLDPVRLSPHSPARERPLLTWLDVALPTVLGLALAIETLVIARSRGPAWANVVVALLVAAPLVLRRTHPIVATTLTSVAGIAMSAWLTPIPLTVTGVGLLVVIFYSLGAWGRGRAWIAGWAVAAAGVAAMQVVSGDVDMDDSLLMVMVLAVGTTLVGRVTAGWQQRLRRTEEVLAALEAGRGAAVRLAVARERQSLAAELHDTVAHAMTVVCVQAAAQQRAGGDPAAVLRTISSTAADSLAELRDGLDRIETGHNPLLPTRITALGRRVGVDVATTSPSPPPTGPAAALAYRTVREAVVNAARHAPGASVEVRIEACADALEVTVTDDGGSRGHPLQIGTGSGLGRLDATVTETGGILTWGARPGGGFEVRARIPHAALQAAP